MASTLTRRPLPAVVAILALLLLTAIVWWRVIARDDPHDSNAAPCPSSSPSVSSTAPVAPTTVPAPKDVTVQVLNSTQRAGIAGKARAALLKDGFKSPSQAGNDPNSAIPGTAEIRYGPTGHAAATLLKYYFPGATLVANTSKAATIVVSLGAKYAAVATPAQAQAAMARNRVTVAGAPSTPAASASASHSAPTSPSATRSCG